MFFGILLFVALAATLSWLMFSLREPAYKGRRLRFWLSNYSWEHSSPEVDEAVHEMGTNCLPLLVDWLGAKGPAWTNRLGLRLFMFDPGRTELRRAQAAKAFAALGEEAWPAVPMLVELYQRNPSNAPGHAAVRALSEIGSSATNAVPFLLLGATNADPGVRVAAVGALSQIRYDPKQVVPALISCLKDPDKEVRDFAAFALACYGKEAGPAIPALLEALKDSYHQVRGNSIWALSEARVTADLGVPAFTMALADPNGFVRSRAAQALGKFGTNATPAREALTQLLGDSDQGARENAAKSLKTIDAAGVGR